MKTLSSTKWLVLIGIIIAAAIVAIPPTAMAGDGGGPFPGAGCADATVGVWKYAPPPYIGEIRVYFIDGGEIYISTGTEDDPYSGPLVQSGNSNCDLTFPFPGVFIGIFEIVEGQTMLDTDFKNLKSVDMQGMCFQYQGEGCFEGNMELLSVANMRFGQEINGQERLYFDAHALIMPLTLK